MPRSDFPPAAKPAFPDIGSCEAWLATAPLGDSRQACAAFLSLLDDMAATPPERRTHLQMLEHLLPRMLPAISEQTRRFAAKPLPLAPAEAAAFGQVDRLWLTLLRDYRKLLRSAVEAASAEAESNLALLAARSTACASELICAHLLARREVGADLWQWLHVSYAFAESRGLCDMTVGGDSSACAYVQALLFALAQPQSLSQRDLFWTRAWTRRFARKVRLVRRIDRERAHAVDLGGGHCATWRVTADAAHEPDHHDSPLRFLDTVALGHSLRRRLRRLEAGDAPASLGLGQNCTQPGAAALLRKLLLAWCAAPVAPQYPRRPVAPRHAQARVAIGLAAAYAAVGGKPLAGPPDESRNWDYNRRDADNIHAFQRTYGPSDRLQAQAPQMESWLALDESACGFRLQRQAPGSRVAHRQLLGLRAGGAPQCMLGEVRWMIQGAGEDLVMGVLILPGLPRACAARPHLGDAKPQPFTPALLLPQAQGVTPSLFLPAGWYQRERLLELRLDSGVVRIRLFGLVERGFDYDRVNFTADL